MPAVSIPPSGCAPRAVDTQHSPIATPTPRYNLQLGKSEAVRAVAGGKFGFRIAELALRGPTVSPAHGQVAVEVRQVSHSRHLH